MNSSNFDQIAARTDSKTQTISFETLDQVEDFGIDLSLLTANLRLTPIQRIRQHQRNLDLANQLRNSMKQTLG